MNCPVCGHPMNHFIQPSFSLDRPDIEQAECRQDCDYRYVTLTPQEHAAMTPERRESYLKTNRRMRARHAFIQAQEDSELEAMFAAAGLSRKAFWGQPSEWHRD